MKSSFLFKLLIAIGSVSMLATASAHGVQGGGFINGLMHPVFGPDHLLAMICVGILSAQIGGKAIWSVPAAFVLVMLAGGIWGMLKMPFPAVETGIAASVLALGLAIALDTKLPVLISMIFVGFFGAFHGYAHGLEMPAVARPELYAAGFMISTISLHIVGVVIAEISKHFRKGRAFLRYLGAGIAGIGFALLTGI